jgi:hypothetical protein
VHLKAGVSYEAGGWVEQNDFWYNVP